MNRFRHHSSKVFRTDFDPVRETFAAGVNKLWLEGGKKERVGLAISGGVDSMALATLCHNAYAHQSSMPQFTGFIVDHTLRRGSGDEARKVADELDKLKIEPHILHLDWTGIADPPSLPNLESVARKLRYQALGRACRGSDITSLLVGHHADDQAETILMRIISSYTGTGLAGIKPSMPLPECQGIYGIDHSGQPRNTASKLKIEGGGVKIHRPLLDIRKHQLVSICRESNVRWFEDHTNADVTLTLRNALRHLLRDEQSLPRALRHGRLLELCEDRRRKEVDSQTKAGYLFAGTRIHLDLRSGHSTFIIDKELRSQSVDQQVARQLIRQTLRPVSPKQSISLQDLDQTVALALQHEDAEAPGKRGKVVESAQCAGVQLRAGNVAPQGSRDFTAFRALPPTAEASSLVVQLWPLLIAPSSGPTPQDEGWSLWDGRYWIRVQPPEHGCTADMNVSVRLLGKDGLAKLRSMREDAPKMINDALRRLKRIRPHEVRLTLPAIFVSENPGIETRTNSQVSERLVALPSIGWFVAGWAGANFHGGHKGKAWRCDIRYKHVELREDQLLDVDIPAKNKRD